MSLAHSTLVWPGITEEQACHPALDWDHGGVWAEWIGMALAPGPVADAIQKRGFESLIAHHTEGMDEATVSWTSPAKLAAAARELGELFRSRDEDTLFMLTLMSDAWGGSDLAAEEYREHLEQVARSAEHASSLNVEAVATWLEF